MTFFTFLLLTLSFLSLWIGKDPKIWGTLLIATLLSGWIGGSILFIGLGPLFLLYILWIFYVKKPALPLFILLILLTLLFKFRLLPGYQPFPITSKFQIGLEGPLTGFFPLALLVPLARSKESWKTALRGAGMGALGITLLAVIAIFAKATSWNWELPSFFTTRLWSNLILTSVPEEGFYRGFVQRELYHYLPQNKGTKATALLLSSLLFTAAHLYWSPNLTLLIFVFLASLLYGSIYLLFQKIESAILCHFLLNLVHMVFFEYHPA